MRSGVSWFGPMRFRDSIPSTAPTHSAFLLADDPARGQNPDIEVTRSGAELKAWGGSIRYRGGRQRTYDR